MNARNEKFPLGQVVVTSAVQETINNNRKFSIKIFVAIKRHSLGDWGDVSDKDKETNETALQEDERLFSIYKIEPEIWIITERDRSVTTILFPEDY